ncbi:MAG TPA: site-specific DNA-methyltransferase [Longilinea sp.]|nr:site-specific DNA-methyltransferase [Longilinea sp.]
MDPVLPLDQVINGDCIEVLQSLPSASVDLIFADPPYNLQLQNELRRPDNSLVDAVDEDWDKFTDFSAYDDFTRAWLTACRRVLKRSGALWVIGSYHNIYRVGAILQDLGYWVLNDIVWIKNNPMPNFRGVRFTNAHETLIWAQKERGAPYTFHHHSLKALNDDLQMRSDWYLPICTGKERLRHNGQKVHSTQKPESLLYRILMATTNPGDVVLDPFLGAGTTAAAARLLGRHWIGIEKDTEYATLAARRIAAVQPVPEEHLHLPANPRSQPRIAVGTLLETGLLKAGQTLTLGPQGPGARLLADGRLEYNGVVGSIHQIARQISPQFANGWECWFYQDPSGTAPQPINALRQLYRAQNIPPQEAIHDKEL